MEYTFARKGGHEEITKTNSPYEYRPKKQNVTHGSHGQEISRADHHAVKQVSHNEIAMDRKGN